MAELFERAKKAQAELLECRSALAVLYADANPPQLGDELKRWRATEERLAPVTELRLAMRDFVNVGLAPFNRGTENQAAEAGKLWARAKAALFNDADIDLPPVEGLR
jgi:hypothetical protein